MRQSWARIPLGQGLSEVDTWIAETKKNSTIEASSESSHNEVNVQHDTQGAHERILRIPLLADESWINLAFKKMTSRRFLARVPAVLKV